MSEMMDGKRIAGLPRVGVTVEAGDTRGSLDISRHGIGYGGVNPRLPVRRVIDGATVLRPRWIRIFIQEFFRIYPERGRFDWSILDPYMDSLAATGAKIVAAITIKPSPIFPVVDHALWRPDNEREWRRVVFELVHRYSVVKPIVTHWEIGNEPDIGENGGCPYLIPDPGDYYEYYRMSVEPVLQAFPEAKVGGPAVCWAGGEPLPGLIERCAATGLPLDFISWHHYGSDPDHHASGVRKAIEILGKHRKVRAGTMVTEWAPAFDPVSVAELASDPARAALVAAAIIAMHDAGVDGTFYYHLCDQTCRVADFKPFFSPAGIAMMLRHWNELPHRFGLFGPEGDPRLAASVFDRLRRMGEERIAASADDPALRVLASRGDRRVTVMVVHHGNGEGESRVATIRFTGLTPGEKQLAIYRIPTPSPRHDALEPSPMERRKVDTIDTFECQILSPVDSVAWIELSDVDLPST